MLIDGRHGLKPVDAEMFDLLDRAAMSYQIVLTKRDEVKAGEQDERIAETLAALEKRPAAYPEVIFTCPQKGSAGDCATARRRSRNCWPSGLSRARVELVTTKRIE